MTGDLIALGVGRPASIGTLLLVGLFNSVTLDGSLPADMLVTEAAYTDVARSVTSQFQRTIGAGVVRTIGVG